MITASFPKRLMVLYNLYNSKRINMNSFCCLLCVGSVGVRGVAVIFDPLQVTKDHPELSSFHTIITSSHAFACLGNNACSFTCNIEELTFY